MDDNGGHHHGKLEVSRPMAALFGIGFTFVLLAIIHLIYVGWCKNTTPTAPSEIRTRALQQPEPSEPPPPQRVTGGESDGSRLQLIVTMRYGKERKEEECVVCLSQFVIGEEVRVLVRCGHVFHVACIDMWLCSHPTCPICRVNTVAEIR